MTKEQIIDHIKLKLKSIDQVFRMMGPCCDAIGPKWRAEQQVLRELLSEIEQS